MKMIIKESMKQIKENEYIRKDIENFIDNELKNNPKMQEGNVLNYVYKSKIEIIKQREEILTAFIAKYNLEPEEIEQVINNKNIKEIVWSVRKKNNDNSCQEIDLCKNKKVNERDKTILKQIEEIKKLQRIIKMQKGLIDSQNKVIRHAELICMSEIMKNMKNEIKDK